jgi:hypothetical protein
MQAAVVAHQFLITIKTANAYLRQLHEDGHIVKTKKSRHVYWGRIEQDAVAVPARVNTEPRPTSPVIHRPLPIQNSYPHIRGYDD